MVNTQDGEVVLDIDDTAERPISDHDDDTEHEEDAGSQQDMDDSVHAFTGHEGEGDYFFCSYTHCNSAAISKFTALGAGPVYATAWNRNHANMVATGGGDDVAFIWQVVACQRCFHCIKPLYSKWSFKVLLCRQEHQSHRISRRPPFN